MTPLQKHVAFFDSNKDGIVYPWETYKGFRAVGFGVMKSLAAGVLINVALSYSTLPGRMPSLLFPIYINNIHKAKHGSDTDVYDKEGNFDSHKFEAIFSKYACTQKDRLTRSELDSMLKSNREPKNVPGWIASKVEWDFLYDLAKDDKGFLEKEAIRGVYDGTLFELYEKKNCDKSILKK
ncbi:peroxygenase isoform X2 [Cryptomeria japonica]|nr:peroxygenase isoform X2 [Cryptomeria japonica]